MNIIKIKNQLTYLIEILYKLETWQGVMSNREVTGNLIRILYSLDLYWIQLY